MIRLTRSIYLDISKVWRQFTERLYFLSYCRIDSIIKDNRVNALNSSQRCDRLWIIEKSGTFFRSLSKVVNKEHRRLYTMDWLDIYRRSIELDRVYIDNNYRVFDERRFVCGQTARWVRNAQKKQREELGIICGLWPDN